MKYFIVNLSKKMINNNISQRTNLHNSFNNHNYSDEIHTGTDLDVLQSITIAF